MRARLAICGGALAFALSVALTACGVPADPDGTTTQVQGAVLRAGASPSEGEVVINGRRVSGPLADLIDGFAADMDARVVWTIGSEEQLVDALENGTLDVAVGGMSAQTPWVDRAGVTREYFLPTGESFVVLLPLGENGFQAALEHYLDEELS
ncbi:hypothetical protein [Microbacterium schleiferi]|uniref:hypothetical protein n=1 Tax=Microbacterium schleiferi TaxID=69362 RepID=UPI00311F11E5|tara:strand:+ start:415 stop:873 length:459 start_codon:yes stop_codon:yes gene_type:complete